MNTPKHTQPDGLFENSFDDMCGSGFTWKGQTNRALPKLENLKRITPMRLLTSH